VARAGIAQDELKSALEELCRRYDRRYLDSDPVGIVRRYDDPRDREIVGLLAAGLAYGRVASIRASLERLLAILGPRPSRFVRGFDASNTEVVLTTDSDIWIVDLVADTTTQIWLTDETVSDFYDQPVFKP